MESGVAAVGRFRCRIIAADMLDDGELLSNSLDNLYEVDVLQALAVGNESLQLPHPFRCARHPKSSYDCGLEERRGLRRLDQAQTSASVT